jgi:hypothetical protein
VQERREMAGVYGCRTSQARAATGEGTSKCHFPGDIERTGELTSDGLPVFSLARA